MNGISSSQSAQEWVENPIPYVIPNIDEYLDLVKQLVDYDESTGESVAWFVKNHPDKDAIWDAIPPDIQLELFADNRFLGRVKQQILPMEENPICAYVAGRG